MFNGKRCLIGFGLAVSLSAIAVQAGAARDKMVGIHSARVMSQSMPWMAHEAGLFKKYNLDSPDRVRR